MINKYFVMASIAIISIATNNLFAQQEIGLNPTRSEEIQRVRVDFETPMGFVRHLLLGFTPDNSATDGFDYGYDAANIEDFPDDLNWMIEGQRYVIQGVGAFNENKAYPFGMFLSNSGEVKFSLLSLENFSESINVFIYDILENSYYKINDSDFSIELNSDEYINRFYIAFKDQNQLEDNLSLDEHFERFISLKYNEYNRLLHIDVQNKFKIESLEIYNTIGKKLYHTKPMNTGTVELQLNKIHSNFLILKFETSVGILFKKIML